MAANQRKYEIADFKRAIEQAGGSAARIAAELGCTRSTVYAYLKRFPEVRALFEARKGEAVQERPQYPREAFEKAIAGSWGIKATIAQKMGCSRQTVDNALAKWPELEPLLAQERVSIVDLAETKLVDAVNNGDMRALLFTLETLGKDRGWTKRTELTGADGANLLGLPDDVLKLIEAMGLDASEVARQFVQMVRLAAMQRGLTGG